MKKSKKPSLAQDRVIAVLIRSAESDAALAAKFFALTTRFEALIAACVPATRTADSATQGEPAHDTPREPVENLMKYCVWAIFIAIGATIGRLFGPAGVSILSAFALIGASLMARSDRRAIAGALVVIRPTLKGERNTAVNTSTPSTSLETGLAIIAALLGVLYVILYTSGVP